MKVIGVGLNKTGTKTLRYHLMQWGFRHRSYELPAFRKFQAGQIEELLQSMEAFDSFEDWPWPLMYREIDQRYPDAKFILTTRSSPQAWYRSLCKMAVRMGPLNDFEKYIYGYAMPQGRKQQHLQIYERHNQQVREYFADRPAKLLELCWEQGGTATQLADFLKLPDVNTTPQHLNSGMPVYGGENLWCGAFPSHRIPDQVANDQDRPQGGQEVAVETVLTDGTPGHAGSSKRAA